MGGDEKCGQKKGLMIVGILLIIVAVTADLIGLGASDKFGYKQIALLIIGLALVATCLKSCKKS